MKKLIPLLLAALATPAWATTYYAADQDFSPAGNDSNDGLSAANPKTDEWCRTTGNLSAGDTCIYAAGNYGGDDFDLDGMNGSSGNLITHRCEGQYTCSFDRWAVLNSSYIELINLKSESDFYDSTHSDTNPRIRVRGSNDIYFTAVFIRGEPYGCAEGWIAFNGGPGDCRGTSYRRYNDVFTIGDNSVAENSYRIALRSSDTWGATQLYNASHELIQIHDDKNNVLCEATEQHYYIGGTLTNPLIVSNEEHHIIANKGGCHVLMEHIDFQKTGTGRGDQNQTEGFTIDEPNGGTIHGATNEHFAIRFSTLTGGGAHSSTGQNSSIYEVGLFGGTAGMNYGCFAHNSVWRPWATTAIFGEVNGFGEEHAILNVAVDEGSYGYEQDGAGVATSAYIGYVIGVTNTNVVGVYVDGLVYDVVSGLEGDKLLVDKGDSDTFTSADCPSSNLGADTDVECGSSITYANTTFFTDPANRDFTISDTTNLEGTAVAIAKITTSETDTTLDVTNNRAQCFFDDMGGIRASGDVLDINGDECTVTAVDYVNNTITCSSSITVASGEDIFFKVGGAVHNDIGAIASGGSGPGNPEPGPGVNLKRNFYDGP